MHTTMRDTVIDKFTGRVLDRCTDSICLYIFLAYTAVLVGPPVTAIVTNGADLNRISYGVDYCGRICGVDPEV